MFPAIDQEKTGVKLKGMLKKAGYDVKFVQEYLHLSCSQSIYRWFKGKTLPSVENLCALSRLLGVHMEDMLVLYGRPLSAEVDRAEGVRMKRLFFYAKELKKIA